MERLSNIQKVILLYLIGASLAYTFKVADFEHTAMGFLISIVCMQLESSVRKE